MNSPFGRPSIPPLRLLRGEVAQSFFEKVLEQARQAELLSDEHFTVDGTLVEAWASHKSVKGKDGGEAGNSDADKPDDPGNSTVNFRGEKRLNETHQSTADPDARLYRKSKGTGAFVCYLGHAL
ncbi:MAG: hypothetical protein OEW39_13740, partial [Deltaproteobacteria bacterium]|nr:hypothetical protein [Deltaproteobacteria bacterium]